MENKEININNPIFESMLKDLDKEIKRVIDKVYDKDFESGDITLKLNLSLVEDFKEFPRGDELGFKENEIYYFSKPFITHNVSTTLKKQFKTAGEINPEAEIKKRDENYILEPIKDPQINMLDADEFLR